MPVTVAPPLDNRPDAQPPGQTNDEQESHNLSPFARIRSNSTL